MLTFSLVALVAGLRGSFQRHGNVLRPLVAVATVVALLALGLAVNNLAGRAPSLTPLIWLQPLLPAAVAIWLLSERMARPARDAGALVEDVG